MRESSDAVIGVRCLQQLGGASAAEDLRASEIALLECLEPGATRDVLEQLRAAGFVETPAPGHYRLARPPAEIRVAEVWRALGGLPGRAAPHQHLTLADLIRWESKVFADASIAQAA